MRNSRGFTVIELVVVLVLVGIVSAMALPRFFSRSAFESAGYADSALAALRYAHKLAVASGCNIGVQFSASGYRVLRGATCGATTLNIQVPRPGSSNENFTDTPPNGSTVSSQSIYFDAAGRTHDAGSSALLGAPVDVSVAGFTIRIEHETGFARKL